MAWLGTCPCREPLAKPLLPAGRAVAHGVAPGWARAPAALSLRTAPHAEGRPASLQTRTASVRQAQRVLGNRAAQRVVQRFSGQPVHHSAGSARSPESGAGSLPHEPAAPIERALPVDLRAASDAPMATGTAAPFALSGIVQPGPLGPAVDAALGRTEPMPAPAPIDAGVQAEGERALPPIGKVAGGADAPLNAAATAQAKLISADSLRSEAQIMKLAAAQRAQVSGQLGGLRSTLSGFFAQSAAGVQRLIASKQAEVTAASAAILQSVQTMVANGLQAAEAQGGQARAAITGVIEGVTASVQGRVQAVAQQITGVIHSVPLADLPGAAQLRRAAAGVLARAAGAVTGGLGRVMGIIGSAMNAGMSLLQSMFGTFAKLVNAALAQAAAAVQRIVQSIFQSLARVASLVASALQKALNGIVLPMLARVEAAITQAIGKVQQQAMAALRTNRDQHLKALVSAPQRKAGGGDAGGAAAKTAAASDGAAALRVIGQEAMQNNQSIVQTFEERTSGIVAQILQAMSSATAQIVQRITAVVAQAMEVVVRKVVEAVQGLGQIARAVGSFVQSVIQALSGALGSVVQFVRGLVQSPIEQLLRFAQGTLSRMSEFVGRIVRSLASSILGSAPTAEPEGLQLAPNYLPAPAFVGPAIPVVIAILTAIVTFIGGSVVVIGGTVMIIIGGGVYFVSTTVVVVVAAVLALLALLLLVLLFRQIFKPKPLPPAPPPTPPEKITSLTVVESPGARTRTTIGVGEQVFLTHTPGPAVWTTTAGTISPPTGDIVVLTAPDTAKAVTVTAGAAAIAFTVIPPNGIHMDRFPGTGIKHTNNFPDSGIRTQPFLLPDTVNFSRVLYREVDVPATANGTYSCHNGTGHDANPKTLTVSSTVVAGKGTKANAVDTAYSGHCGGSAPFVPGSITFDIPNEYKVAGGGSFHRFGNALQVHALAADASTLTSDKAGAHGATTVTAPTSAF